MHQGLDLEDKDKMKQLEALKAEFKPLTIEALQVMTIEADHNCDGRVTQQ